MSEIDTANLREIASAATPGPWFEDDAGWLVIRQQSMDDPVICDLVDQGDADDPNHYGTEADNATHIAAFDPTTALALLDEIDRLRAENAAYAKRDAEVLATIERGARLRALLRRAGEALNFYGDISKYPAPLTGGMGELWSDCGITARTVAHEIEEAIGHE